MRPAFDMKRLVIAVAAEGANLDLGVILGYIAKYLHGTITAAIIHIDYFIIISELLHLSVHLLKGDRKNLLLVVDGYDERKHFIHLKPPEYGLNFKRGERAFLHYNKYTAQMSI